MIEFDRVLKSYGRLKALNHLSFLIEPEEMVFLTGHSGAGKSTLLKLIMGIEKPTAGIISVNQKPLSSLSHRHLRTLRRQIGIITQAPQLLAKHSVYNNTALPLLISGVNRRDIPKATRAALDMVGLLNKQHTPIENLSCGEQQRIGIARAIVNSPKILLADEPTGNLDPELSIEIIEIFSRLNQTGTCVLIASHDFSLIQQFNCRLLTLKQGSLIGQEEKTTCPA